MEFIRNSCRAVRLALCPFLLCVHNPRPGAQTQASHATAARSQAVEIQMRYVNFGLTRDIALEVRSLRGQLERTRPAIPVTFDDPGSFVGAVSNAEGAITPASLTKLMNSYVLAYEGTPIKHVDVTLQGQKLTQKGTIPKVVDRPFEMEGKLSVTEGGTIRVHAHKIKSAHLPLKGCCTCVEKIFPS